MFFYLMTFFLLMLHTWLISTFCVLGFFAFVSGWRRKSHIESEFEQQCQMSPLCLSENRRHGFKSDPEILSLLNVYKTLQENCWDMLSLHAPGPVRSAQQISQSRWHMCSWMHLFCCLTANLSFPQEQLWPSAPPPTWATALWLFSIFTWN